MLRGSIVQSRSPHPEVAHHLHCIAHAEADEERHNRQSCKDVSHSGPANAGVRLLQVDLHGSNPWGIGIMEEKMETAISHRGNMGDE